MNDKRDLQNLLRQIDHKSYGAYKTLKGSYRFDGWILHIDTVQGDPFASPSRVRLEISNKNNFPKEYYDAPWRRTALEDHLLRQVHRVLRQSDIGRAGSGKSGQVSICSVGQKVQEQIAVVMEGTAIQVRLEVGFPAHGRTIATEGLVKIFYRVFPALVEQVFTCAKLPAAPLRKCLELADDQQAVREQLEQQDLCAFLADGSILPRESGISDRPMKGGVAFRSPDEDAVTLSLPHAGKVRGMGIRRGVTLIAGGGYHGKSTLLKAIEAGVYNHIAGDGRELVITDQTAVKLRAEEGRSIHGVDISLFLNHLPSGADTTDFYTENASGSTSQAANTVEAIAGGAGLLLIDEDTSATNFMVRDSIMAQLVNARQEPISPFISCVRSLYEELGISTILVVGSSGSFLSIADTVIQMDCYQARDVTRRAKELAGEIPTPVEPGRVGRMNASNILKKSPRREKPDKLRVRGTDSMSLGREEIDLRYLEQITGSSQCAGLAYLMEYVMTRLADGKKNTAQLTDELMRLIHSQGFAALVPTGYPAGPPVMPRKQELMSCLQRYRRL